MLPRLPVMLEARCVDRDCAKLRSRSVLCAMRRSRSRSLENRPGDRDRDHDRAKIGLEIAIAIAIGGTALAGDVGER